MRKSAVCPINLLLSYGSTRIHLGAPGCQHPLIRQGSERVGARLV